MVASREVRSNSHAIAGRACYYFVHSSTGKKLERTLEGLYNFDIYQNNLVKYSTAMREVETYSVLAFSPVLILRVEQKSLVS